MLEKTKQKLARKARPTWGAYYTRKTPTKAEKQKKLSKKHRKPLDKCADL